MVGDPIDHSLSPFIHSKFGALNGMEIDYQPFHVVQKDLIEFIKDIKVLKEYWSLVDLKILFLDWDNMLTEAQVLNIISKDFTFLVIFILPIGKTRDWSPIFDSILGLFLSITGRWRLPWSIISKSKILQTLINSFLIYLIL